MFSEGVLLKKAFWRTAFALNIRCPTNFFAVTSTFLACYIVWQKFYCLRKPIMEYEWLHKQHVLVIKQGLLYFAEHRVMTKS